MQEKLAGYFALLLYAAGTVGLVWLCVRFILPWAAPFITAYVLAALLGGNLSVYYGDEIAMDGGQDPDNRRPMRWTDPEEEIRGFFHSLLRLKRDVLRHCRLTAMELTDALYLHFDGSGYGILAVVTERGQAVTPQLDASDSLLLEAPEGHAAEGTVQGFAVFRREVTHDGNT